MFFHGHGGLLKGRPAASKLSFNDLSPCFLSPAGECAPGSLQTLGQLLCLENAQLTAPDLAVLIHSESARQSHQQKCVALPPERKDASGPFAHNAVVLGCVCLLGNSSQMNGGCGFGCCTQKLPPTRVQAESQL